MNDISGLLDAMQRHGLVPVRDNQYPAPGSLVRMPGAGKPHGNKAGWCKLFLDGIGAVFGDWSTGLVETWQAKRDNPYTPAERTAFSRMVADHRAQADTQKVADYTAAAQLAAARWDNATPATYHPYLQRKRILFCGIRQDGNLLIIPIRDTAGKIWSIQTINPDGVKMFMKGGRIKGGFYLIGGPIDNQVFICEGFATAATVHIYGDEIGAKGAPVVCAFNTSNLKPVAIAIRHEYPAASITICADNDSNTPGNPGLIKARAAAALVGAGLVYPNFENEPFTGTDFNDYCAAGGEI